ncbi:MAG: DUF721 domain-containing protein [Lentisphaeria bacterium]
MTYGKGKKRYSGEGPEKWLDRDENRHRQHFGRHPSYREHRREQAIRDWLGPAAGRQFILNHQRSAEHISTAMGEVLKSIGMRRQALLEELMDNWSDVVGADIAKKAHPCRLVKKRLEIEVENPSWLYILRTVHAESILKRVKQYSEEAINEIRFVPAGRHQRR